MTFVDTNPVIVPPIEQLEEMKPIKTRKAREQKHDFKDGFGRVPAQRHKNGRGWVAKTAVVEDSVYVGPRAEVFNNAYVSGNVRLEGNARVSGNAIVRNDSRTMSGAATGPLIVKQSAHVYGSAVVRDGALIAQTARVAGQAHVSGASRVMDAAVVDGCAQIISTTVSGRARIRGHALVVRSACTGDVVIDENANVINSTVYGNVEICGFGQLLGGSQIRNSHSTIKTTITDYAVVADRSEVWAPVLFKDHTITVACRLSFNTYTPGAGTEYQRPEIRRSLVLQNVRAGTVQQLNEVLAGLNDAQTTQGSPTIGWRATGPQAQIVGVAARQVNHLEVAARPRRVQRLQESSV